MTIQQSRNITRHTLQTNEATTFLDMHFKSSHARQHAWGACVPHICDIFCKSFAAALVLPLM